MFSGAVDPARALALLFDPGSAGDLVTEVLKSTHAVNPKQKQTPSCVPRPDQNPEQSLSTTLNSIQS